MATDYTKQSSDALIVIIKDAFPRFKDNNRIVKLIPVGGEIRHVEKYLGPDDSIILSPGEVAEETTLLLTSGEIADQTWHILYFNPKKISNEQEILDEISGFAQDLIDVLIANKDHPSGYWHNLRTQLNYSVDIPENYDGDLFGFELIIDITLGKFP